jgi:diphosphomevalonate decarboxylase
MQTAWQSPSNIAIVKYWGKYEPQLPANASLSFTLDACNTQTRIKATASDARGGSFTILVDGKEQPAFAPKIKGFFDRIAHILPWLRDYQFEIDTHNTFPHSSGIASSASGMSAIALCLVDFHKMLGGEIPEGNSRELASVLSRLGSGSAARSIYGGAVVWGKHPDIPGSSNEAAVEVTEALHPIFRNYQDVVLLVEKGKKSTSSTAGHGLMKNHPYASARFSQANSRLSELMHILRSGDTERFAALSEAEALTLHAMMMTSEPNFILMKPDTLAILEHIRQFRADTGIQLAFTLDAGANVHLLFPENTKQKVMPFVNEILVAHCKDEAYICDQVGTGPKPLK